MMFQAEQPFHYLLMQKISPSHNKFTQNIRLNLNKLPFDFFPQQSKRINSHSQRLPTRHYNQFIGYHKTIDMQKPRKLESFSRRQAKNTLTQTKRQFTSDTRRRPQKRRLTQQKQVELVEFKGTFSRRMYSECSYQKKLQLPALQSARKVRAINMHGVI